MDRFPTLLSRKIGSNPKLAYPKKYDKKFHKKEPIRNSLNQWFSNFFDTDLRT
jgi:hypothetical protein